MDHLEVCFLEGGGGAGKASLRDLCRFACRRQLLRITCYKGCGESGGSHLLPPRVNQRAATFLRGLTSQLWIAACR